MNGLGKYTRVLHYVTKLEENSKIDIKDFKTVQDLKERLKHTGAKLRSLEMTRIFFFIILYSSIISAFTSIVPGLEIITNNIIKFGSVLGSTISLLVVALLSKTITIYTIDLNIISAHLISLYSKNARPRTQLRKKKKQA